MFPYLCEWLDFLAGQGRKGLQAQFDVSNLPQIRVLPDIGKRPGRVRTTHSQKSLIRPFMVPNPHKWMDAADDTQGITFAALVVPFLARLSPRWLTWGYFRHIFDLRAGEILRHFADPTTQARARL